jgi:predicted MPP superfamily phosphohydrolase
VPRLAWATDIHLEFCTPARIDAFADEVRAAAPDALLLGGDIGQATSVVGYLRHLERALTCPIYFVLGNHDFYHGGIARVRADVAALAAASERLRWLPNAGVVPLGARTALVGVDGWADGRLGDYWGSPVLLNDYRLIHELAFLDASTRYRRLNALGDEQAFQLDLLARQALATHEHIIVLTHVPPFAEAAWHEGRQSDPDWLPHFSCKAMGAALHAAMIAHPECEMLVLCGHTHGAGEAQILPNLRVITGGAEYGDPRVQTILNLD